MNSQMKRYPVKGLEGPTPTSFCPCGAGVCQPSQNVEVSTNPEALRTLYFGDFYGDLTAWA